MKFDVLDQTGKKTDTITLHKQIFEAVINPALVAQAIRVRLHNARTGTANTKTRDEVRGGGRKPWRQKGTGRARHGSIRSPLWRGGGITHGPRAGRTTLSMPATMRRAALFSALSDKLSQNGVVVVDALKIKNYKTKEFAKILASLPVDRSALIVLPKKDEKLQRAIANLPQVKLMVASVLHPYEVLKYGTVIFTQDSLPVLEKTFLKGQEKREKVQVDSVKREVEDKSIEDEVAATAVKSEVKAGPAAKKTTKAKASTKSTKATAKDDK